MPDISPPSRPDILNQQRQICVVFVSHRLVEVMAISDRITVLKNGKPIGTYPAADIDNKKLAFLMTGLAFSCQRLAPHAQPGDVALEVKHLSRLDEYYNVSLRVHKGEIVAITGLLITGLLGAGRTELCMTLFGLTRPAHGEILVDGTCFHAQRRHWPDARRGKRHSGEPA